MMHCVRHLPMTTRPHVQFLLDKGANVHADNDDALRVILARTNG